MRLVPTLYAERLEGNIRYRLEVPEHDVGLPLQEEFSHGLDRATVLALRQSADALLRSPESPAFLDEARQRGSVLYRTLLPQRLREQLKRLSGPLLISTSLYGIPWELLYDDEEFWGVRYAIGKRIMMTRPLTAGRAAGGRSRPRALVVGSDPRGDLPFVHDEIERICGTLRGFAEICCVSGSMATFDSVTAYLREGFDLIHYCGHVLAGRAGGPALLLADETPLAAEVIEPNLAGQPLVFLNGCASARGGEHEPTHSWEEHFSGVAHGFLFGGALAVVGTHCDVSDRHAASFAEGFYQQALIPLPVGEALRGARERCRADPASAMSPTWLSFVLYGNPAQVLLRPAAELATVPTRSQPPPAVGTRRQAPLPRLPRSTAVRAGLILVLALAAASGLAYSWFRTPRPQSQLVVGVMEVQARGVGVPDWMREVIRDGLNTILSKLSAVRVYSRQKIDFTRDKRHLNGIEAAETLGITKMIDATLSVTDTEATLEVQIVDIASGLLAASERAQGPVGGLIELQNEVVVKALKALGIKPSEEELKTILANRTNETLETYKLLNETLGGEEAEPKLPAPHERPPGPSSGRWRAVAFAQEPSADEKAIHALIEQYRSALEREDVDDLASIQAEMAERQRSALLQYFANATGLAVHISDVDIQIEGDEALATFTREDVFTDAPSGRPLDIVIRISSVLGRHDGGWRILSLKKPL